MSKNSQPIVCEKCNFKCFKHNEWYRHISTAKHNRSMILNDLEQKKLQKTPKNSKRI